jgi:integrase
MTVTSTRADMAARLRDTAARLQEIRHLRVGAIDVDHATRTVTSSRADAPTEYRLRLEVLTALEAWLRASGRPHTWLTTWTGCIGRQAAAAELLAAADAIEQAVISRG